MGSVQLTRPGFRRLGRERTCIGLLVAVALVACQGTVGDGGASGMVESYLTAASSEDGDRGWAMLAGGDRDRVFGTVVGYLDEADASDWDGFDWSVIDEKCDDGVCVVWIAVPSEDAIPEVLARGPILFKQDHVPEGANAVVHVNLRDPFNRGIAMPYG